jgi:hypothetical protein
MAGAGRPGFNAVSIDFTANFIGYDMRVAINFHDKNSLARMTRITVIEHQRVAG